jgi:hypothetical protein
MQTVCGKSRVEQTVMIRKNAAQASNTGGGQGTQRPLNPFDNAALGRRPLFTPTVSRAGIFPVCGTRLLEQDLTQISRFHAVKVLVSHSTGCRRPGQGADLAVQKRRRDDPVVEIAEIELLVWRMSVFIGQAHSKEHAR